MSYFTSVAISQNMPDSLTAGALSAVNNLVQLNLAGHKSCACTIGGTWSGKIVVESTTDGGANWVVSWVQTVTPALASTILSPINSIVANGNYSFFLTAGINAYRVRATSELAWTGTATVTMAATEVAGPNFASTTVVQNILADPLNISYTNLQPLSSYIGIASSTLGIAGIQMTFKSDQNCQISVDQSGLTTAGIGGISTTAGSTALSGLSGTKFTRDFIVGDQIFVSGELPSIVTSIASDTSMSVSLSSVNTANKTFTQYFWDIHDIKTYNPITDNYGETFQAVGLFFRVRIKNINPTLATTYLRMNIALCPIVETMPRSLSDRGNLKTSIYEIEDGDGNSVQITPHHTLRTSQTFKLLGAKFGQQVDTQFWTLTANGTGSGSTIATNVNTLSSGTLSASYAQSSTVRIARLTGGIPNIYRGLHRITTQVVANNTRRFGVYSVASAGGAPRNGHYFEISPTGALSVNCANDGVINKVSSGDFTGNINFYVVDTNVHVYEITYFFATAIFTIDGNTIHTMTPTTKPLVNIIDLPVTSQSVNGGVGAASGILENWFQIVARLGEEAAAPKWINVAGAIAGTGTQLKIGTGRLRGVNLNANVIAGVISIYDSIGTPTNPIALITTTLGNNSLVPINLAYNLDFYNGLYVDQSGTNLNTTFILE